VKKLRKEEDINGLIEMLNYLEKIKFTDQKMYSYFLELSRNDDDFLYRELPLPINFQILATFDEAIDVRMEAAKALIEIGEKAVEPLIHTLRKEYEVREIVAWILGEIGDRRAAEPLIEALKDSDSDFKEEAKNSLVKIGEPAVDYLIKALSNED
jgi:HEAT repeat protein